MDSLGTAWKAIARYREGVIDAFQQIIAEQDRQIVAYQIAKDNLELRLSDADLDHGPDHPGYEVY